ncbi:SDR family NAD(P)-dependent oxidoreductase [Streptacidiphilus sp. ASG 303]|uniref:SDR family NAD(P)-dependent oxidoreductase n=1 Tax=Streptacidiphilus sp. ASG 303 TaxID=2896847 RepID=UPI001E5B7EA7|nr:SDR family NAD(P)-dependent oxidoreductase [Streptacidiphilus sp. ASG 303]MCD0483662.1 SDR family NAD(P)-dependent oxidoreductase [Streptacidiphilus sp. ASG 303]
MAHPTHGSRPAALVVGGTRGIGREIARLLAAAGNDVTVVGRPGGAGAEAAAEIGAAFLPADVSRLPEVRRVAAEVASRHDRLHHLVQSADVIKKERVDTPEGFEVGFATNYLSRFLLAGLLLDRLRAGSARILHVAAAGAAGRFSLGSVPPGPRVGAFRAHGVGQGANDVFGVELAARLAGSGVVVQVANPGAVETGIRDEVATGLFGRTMVAAYGALATVRGPAEAARILLDTAERHSGDVLIGMKGPVRVPARARDLELRRGLWRRTEELVGLTVDTGR